jgi:hypothetical protein
MKKRIPRSSWPVKNAAEPHRTAAQRPAETEAAQSQQQAATADL